MVESVPTSHVDALGDVSHDLWLNGEGFVAAMAGMLLHVVMWLVVRARWAPDATPYSGRNRDAG